MCKSLINILDHCDCALNYNFKNQLHIFQCFICCQYSFSEFLKPVLTIIRFYLKRLDPPDFTAHAFSSFIELSQIFRPADEEETPSKSTFVNFQAKVMFVTVLAALLLFMYDGLQVRCFSRRI